jgi:uncharacterized protein YxeA
MLQNNKSTDEEIISDYLEDKEIKQELLADVKEEFKGAAIVGIAMILVLGVIIGLIFAFRNTISDGFNSLINQVLDITGINLSQEDSNSCTEPFNATYSGETYYNNISNSEKVTLNSDGSYSLSINNDTITSTGTYQINNSTITLTGTNTENNQSIIYTYTLSDECKILTRVDNGIDITLFKE